jgi:porin
VSVYANYTAEVLANWRGGFSRGESFEGVAEAGMELDMQTVAGWKGVTLFAGGMRVHGDDPTVERIGDYNYASNIVCENTTRLYHAWAGWRGEVFATKAGLLSVDDAFMISETSLLFVNSGFGPMPTVSGNTSSPIWPSSALGVWAQWAEARGWQLQAGVYDGDGGDELSNRHGTAVRIGSDEGSVTMIEATREFSLGGRAGLFKIGGWAHSGEFTDFRAGESRRGNQGLYVMVDQELGSAEVRGAQWSGFVRIGRPLAEARNTVRLHADIGISVTELISGRKEDVAGLAIGRTQFGRDYLADRERNESPATQSETVIEATYAISLGRGVTLQPDLQYILDPHESGRDALVGILRIFAEF